MTEKFIVTPWEVKGDVDYDKLIEQFGTEKIDDALLKRIQKHTGELHFMLRRKIFFSHRDMNWLLDEYEKGNKFYLYTGRGPSGHTHLGHLIPWMFAKWLQDKFDCELYFQMTDDEKFYFKEDLSIEEAQKYAYENALDVIALGFNPKKTHIFTDFDYAKTMYKQAARVAKKINFSTVKSVFGFKNETNIGSIFYTSMQAVPAFLPSVLKGKNIPCLIPHGIDQDPHFRVARDVLPKLGYYKPAALHNSFMPGLLEGGKMSASDPNSTIFTTDDEKIVKKKLMRAFTGGKSTVEEQKRDGANPDICTIYAYCNQFFVPDDGELAEIRKKCKEGKIMCGECKLNLVEKANKFLKAHQEKREKARAQVEQFMLKD